MAEYPLDIHKPLDQEMWASEVSLKELTEIIELAALMVRDEEGRILFWSRGCEAMYGWRKAEAEGRVSHELLQTTFPEPLGQIEAQMRCGRLWQGELIHTTRDGGRITVASQWMPSLDDQNRLLRILECNNDITKRKRAEESLAHQSRRLELLSEIASHFLFADEPAATIQKIFHKLKPLVPVDVFFNFLVKDEGDGLWLHSYSGIPEEIGRQVSQLEFGQAVCGTVAATRQPLALNFVQDSADPMADLVKGFGVRTYACNPLLVEDRLLGTLSFGSRTKDSFTVEELDFFRALSRYTALALDRWNLLKATRQRAAELEERVAERTVCLEDSLKSLQGVLYHVAHDLRAPLRAMHSFTELLQDHYAPNRDATGEEYARIIAGASSKMDRLIGDLLHFGRLGHQEIAWTAVNLTSLVNRQIDNLQTRIMDRQAEVQVDAPLPYVLGDAHIIEQVLVNLIENGLKFVPPSRRPRLHIWAQEHNEIVRLNLQDNGIGIAPEYQQRIFGVFERLQNREDYPGTGIGLAIVKKSMERLRGRVGVESVPGEGSRFWLEFRVVNDTARKRLNSNGGSPRELQ